MPYKDKEKAKNSARRTAAKRRATDPQFVESRKEYMRKWRKDNPEANTRKNSARNTKYAEDSEYKNKINRENALKLYKWTPEKYAEKLEEQDGHCALCEKTAGKKSLHVDHDHACCGEAKKFTCGKCNRGILCQSCNTRLGYLELTLREAQVVPLAGSWTSLALHYLSKYKTQETQHGKV